MAAREGPGGARLLVLLPLLLLAGALIWLGVGRLETVRSSYRVADLALRESPATYRLWLEAEVERGGDASAAIAARLAGMRIDHREDLVASIASGAFWQLAPTGEALRQRMAAAQRDGTEAALRRAPAAADLWLALAALRTGTGGFNAAAGQALANSYLFAPLALPVVRPRVFFALGLYPVLPEDLRAGFAGDLAAARRSLPNFYRRLEPNLPEALRGEQGT